MVISGLKSSENSLVVIARTKDFRTFTGFLLLGLNKGIINAVNREGNIKLCLWQPYYYLSLVSMRTAFK